MSQIVYISSPDSQQIYIWKLNEFAETLELMQVLQTAGNVQPIAIHPNHHFLYAGIRPNFGIVTYGIDQEGLLNNIDITKIDNSPTYLMINMKGTILYCASYQYNTISVMSVNKSGIPSFPIQQITGLLGCHSVNTNRNERLLWVPCLKEHAIRLFKIHKFNGMLTSYNPNRVMTKFESGPRHMVFHNLNYCAYVINELNGTIDVIKYDDLKQTVPIIIQTLKILPNNIDLFWAADIHITPDRRWLYCSDRANNIISCFEISNESTQLKFKNYKNTETQPRSFAIDLTGKFLIVAGQKSNYISLYRINSNNGSLNIISRYKSGIGPMWITIISYH